MTPAFARPIVAGAAIALVALVALAGCQVSRHADAPADRQIATLSPAPSRALVGPPAEAPAGVSAADLVGRDGAYLARRLGGPALRRHDGAGEFWRYHGRGCVVQVVLHPGDHGGDHGGGEEGGGPVVTAVTALDADLGPVPPDSCLATLERR